MADKTSASDDVNGIAANQLRQFVERIERLEEEKKALQEDFHTCISSPDIEMLRATGGTVIRS